MSHISLEDFNIENLSIGKPTNKPQQRFQCVNLKYNYSQQKEKPEYKKLIMKTKMTKISKFEPIKNNAHFKLVCY